MKNQKIITGIDIGTTKIAVIIAEVDTPTGTKHKNKSIRRRYLSRHRDKENWDNYMSAGSLSRYILWGEPTLRASIQKYKKRFNLK